jgi:acyl carrier protein
MSSTPELQSFLQETIFNMAFKRVGPSDSLIESGLLDSITLVEVIVAIEEHIGSSVPQHLLQNENFETIDKMVETISKIQS